MAQGKGRAKETQAKAKASRPTPAKSIKTEARQGENEPSVSLELQLRCLDVFRDALKPDQEDVALLQEVKGHLYNRDFATAFGKEEYLRVYASRWSPSRALGYLQVLRNVEEHVLQTAEGEGEKGATHLEVVCLGGGAGAEVVGLAGWLSALRETAPGVHVQGTFVDIADWGVIVDSLHKHCVTAPELSKYASDAAKETNQSLLPPPSFTCRFEQQNVLDWQEAKIASTISPETKLVTLLFTLNELYSTSMPKTQALLSTLTSVVKPGACLLVVDSSGSYSTVSINGAEKKYPMQWLLDYTLLSTSEKQGEDEGMARWEKVVSHESRWFRLPEGLRYPIELENMRYQIHLYRRLPDT